MDDNRWRNSAIFWGVLLAFAALTFFYNLSEVKNLTTSDAFVFSHVGGIAKGDLGSSSVERAEVAAKGYLIKTPGCTIPDLKAMDPLIRKYIFNERPVVCNKGLPPLFEANRTAIYLLEASLEEYDIFDTSKLNCCYQYFRRTPPRPNQADKNVLYDEECHLVTESANVDPTEEYLRIKCQYLKKEIYKDFFSFVPLPLPAIENTSTLNADRLNVLVIGIDAVSRLNFHRQMPKTAFYLEKLKAVELLGYNKVGDNTFPNLIAALTGHDEVELQHACWPSEKSYFDNCSFVWNDFKRNGFTTAFGEDAAWMGLFYFTKRGFRVQPTDYFYDHFDITATQEAGNAHRLNVHQCIGARQSYRVFLSYIENFAQTMHDHRRAFFAFFWGASLSHDFLIKPKLGDRDYLNLLFNLDEAGVLNTTALLLLSDHGIRWGRIRSTYQGRMEERLPLLYLLLPQWYRDKHPVMNHNLQMNVHMLSTPYDLHETFLDLLNPNREVEAVGRSRGVSLFRKLPANRTCSMAGIARHWCTCQQSVKLKLPSKEASEAVNHTLHHINGLLAGYADCARLRLESIQNAHELINDNEMLKYTKSIRDFTVTFTTLPGRGVFEATVRKEVLANSTQFTVTGSVSRINLYGTQSRCISDFHLKLYCYCQI